jgi:HEAT repeat protein
MPLLMRLAQEASGPVRAAAVRALGDLGDQGPAASFFLECLADGSGEVRRAAADSLRAAQPGKLAAAQIVPLTSSPHADVRLVALDLSLQLGAEPAADIIAECLLDEDTAVRIKAIGYAAIRNVPGWSVILRQSLADPSIEIQRATIETLLRRRDPESRRILAEYAEACASPELAAYLRARLQQLANDQARPQRVPNAAARERQLGLPTPAPAPGRPAPRP